MESVLEIYPKVLEVGRKFGKVDVEVFNEGILVGKAMMMCQLIDQKLNNKKPLPLAMMSGYSSLIVSKLLHLFLIHFASDGEWKIIFILFNPIK